MSKKKPSGTWYAIADYCGTTVPVPGVARGYGHQARVIASTMLGLPLEWIRMTWLPKTKEKTND